ncbi:MAG: T9SS C-terminal target domain-containing protein [Ignavibacteriales bacterium]|nr:MAG: T9SS C-terminal target domain-containing protein [Ignavibacteriales bacterium]
MKVKVLLFSLLSLCVNSFSQVITWQPTFPTDNDSLIVLFDAAQGSKGLQGYTGDVYAHTGVITSKSTSSTDWKYVKTNWGQNTAETKLERIGTDLYRFKIKPSIRSFYNVPSGETIKQVAFVFRSANSPYKEGKTETGGDIFLPVYAAGLNLSILSPSSVPFFSTLNDTIEIKAVASNAASITLSVNGQNISTVANDTLSYNLIADSYGKKRIRLTALSNDGQTKSDSFYFMVNYPESVQNLPAGIIDGINYTSSTTATLSLNAPNKSFIYVIGDFNNWEVDSAYRMNITPDHSHYWLELKNLTPAQEYAFQYFVDGELTIQDPYSEKILDPWNDQYIPGSTYPNLKNYPAGKTSGIVGVLQTAQSGYNWQITNFTKPHNTDLVIYEMLLRDFVTTHDYKTLKDTLSYFKNLGVNAIELMPVMEFEGNESWGYNPMMHFALDKYYGTKNDFKAFIDECHANGIAVILDVVLNHSYGLNPLVRLYWNSALSRPAANNPWFNQVSPNTAYSWGYDFNHQSTATQYYVDRVTSYWLTEYNVDGFRFDFTKGFTNVGGDGSARDNSRIAILKRMADKIWEVDSAAYVILEHFADNSEEKELAAYGMMLWGNSNYNYNEASMGYNDNSKSDFSWSSYKARGWAKPHLVSYMESHDEERLMYKNLQYGNSNAAYNIKDTSQALNRMKLVNAFFLAIPGPKMIWQFGELGYDYSIDYNGRVGNKPIRWDYRDDAKRMKLYKVIKAMLKLREYDAFESSNFTTFFNGATKRISITDPSMNVTVIGNFDVVERSMIPYFQNTGTWYDYFTGASLEVTNTQDAVTLQPGEFHIYTTTQLPVPETDILNDVDGNISEVKDFALYQNYPNPFNPATIIKFSVPDVETRHSAAGGSSLQQVILRVYDILGRVVTTLVNEAKAPGNYEVNFDGSNLSSGIYFYQLRAGSFNEVRKMILMK